MESRARAREDGPKEAVSSPHPSWGDHAAAWIAVIGESNFRIWFGRHELAGNGPLRLLVPNDSIQAMLLEDSQQKAITALGRGFRIKVVPPAAPKAAPAARSA